MTVNRKDVRQAVAEVLRGVFGSAVQEVYDYAAADFRGKSPVVRVLSGGSERGARMFGDEVVLVVEFWVLFSQKRSGYTRGDAENIIDDLEWQLATWAEERQNGPLWTGVAYDGTSTVGQTPVVRGEAWLVEMVRLRLTVR